MLPVLIFLLWTASVHCDGRRLVCYYANWAIYRPGLAKFTPENIDPHLCTHLIYAFAGMNKHYELKAFDSYNDLQLGNYKKFTNLKTYNPKLKVMIAVGGWNEGSKRFSKMVESADSRSRFVRGAVSFLRKHDFDGLDLDWEYPGSREGAKDGDKEGYRKLVQELREAFDDESRSSGRPNLLLTMAVPAGKQYIDRGYDLPELNKHLDFINLLTYDYHTGQEAEVKHHAPLGQEPGFDEDEELNVEWTVRYYVSQGCEPSKLVLGIPTYGRSFTLLDPEETETGSPAKGPGNKGNSTREAGYLAYYEICQMVQEEEWELEAPHPLLVGPYAYKDDQWVGFDDEDIIVEKVKFIIREGMGGGMVWTLDNDDFRGRCYGERSPLISALKAALQEGRDLLTQKQGTTVAPVTRRTPSTPPPFTTPDPGAPFECEDEGFFNHPTDCKKYFWCLDAGNSELGLVAHAFNCPAGLFFNKRRDACDYAANVPCRPKKGATTTTAAPRPRPKKKTTTSTTTAAPRPRPRPKKKTTTTTSTTATPSQADEGQNLAELLRLLQKLGVNQIPEEVRESKEATASTATLPEYRSPARRRTTTPEPAPDLFVQYARPDRANRDEDDDDETRDEPPSAVMPRGPQFHGSEEEDSPHRGDEEFPFVYHTPSRHQTSDTTPRPTPKTTPRPKTTTTTTTEAPRRRVVVRVRPVPGEGARPRTRPTVATTHRPSTELMVLPSGKPAVPATRLRVPESRGPALALLADGGVTCLRRGVHRHPKHCNKFVVCSHELDGFIHDCPRETRFLDHKSRCMPGEGCS